MIGNIGYDRTCVGISIMSAQANQARPARLTVPGWPMPRRTPTGRCPSGRFRSPLRATAGSLRTVLSPEQVQWLRVSKATVGHYTRCITRGTCRARPAPAGRRPGWRTRRAAGRAGPALATERVCHYVPISTERAQSYTRSAIAVIEQVQMNIST
jgi:hypothetical protein